MASSSFFSSPSTVATSSPIHTSFFPKTTQHSITKKLKKPNYFAAGKTVSCKATKNGSQQDPTPSQKNGDHSTLNRFDRRDVLIGLGGLYGATNLAGGDPFALAAPTSPNFSNCQDAVVRKPGVNTVVRENEECCPPVPTSEKIKNFDQYYTESRLRLRPAAHTVTPDSEYLAKFKKALQAMRDLPDSDPRSFKAQADVHCAYCNEAYYQAGVKPRVKLQVHYNWLFFPFHRLYLYFFERILRDLADDPTFAIPFWNWDSPAGMRMPRIYADQNSPLYNAKRNQAHLPPKLMYLNYGGPADDAIPDKKVITDNLALMYRQMVCQSKSAKRFFGIPYRAGDDRAVDLSGIGTIEDTPHNNIHFWGGDTRSDNGEDMGNFYSAGRDPLFYALHGNVDRMWPIWKNLPGSKRTEFTDTDWLDSSFLFYDEKKNLVRCKVRDCLDTKKLGYVYEPVDIPWLQRKPVPKRRGKPGRPGHGRARAAEIKADAISASEAFPLTLDKIVRIEVPRGKISRSKSEKEDEEEVLVIENMQFDPSVHVKFDVYINDDDDETPTGPQDSEFLGSFNNLPHAHGDDGGKMMNTEFSLCLNDLLEDLEVEGDETIVVTLVPEEKSKGLVNIGNIKIDYEKLD